MEIQRAINIVIYKYKYYSKYLKTDNNCYKSFCFDLIKWMKAQLLQIMVNICIDFWFRLSCICI